MAAECAADQLLGGRYALVEVLGHGASGVVWRARDQLLHRDVAVKEIRFPVVAGRGAQADLREAILREARAAARLNHPGAVTVYDVVEDDGRPLIVMELVDAPTLAELVERSGPAAAGGGGRHRRRAARRPRRRPRRGHRPPRRQARQRHGRRVVGPGAAGRLRRGVGARRRPDHLRGGDGRVARLHGPRAGDRRARSGGRPTCGPWGRRCTSRSRAARRTTRARPCPP